MAGGGSRRPLGQRKGRAEGPESLVPREGSKGQASQSRPDPPTENTEDGARRYTEVSGL